MYVLRKELHVPVGGRLASEELVLGLGLGLGLWLGG